MKKVLKAFLIINGIHGLVISILFAILTAICVVFSLPFFYDIVINALEDGSLPTLYPGTIEATADYLRTVFIVAAVFCVLFMGFAITSAAFSFKTLKNYSSSLFITNIVFGVLGLCPFGLAAGIMGLIYLDKES
ncbi:MAG TPA: hypothetical protein GX010_02740 [Erysipelotrichaceae bacterium]|nr:hypothetical protein [Erysipelotrichaceae bacterium]